MDKIAQYHHAIVAEMEYQASIPIANRPNTERHLIIDEKRRRYVLFNIGWEDVQYVYGILFHLELKDDGKIWVHENFTDIVLGENLAVRGVNRDDIEVGWVDPFTRELAAKQKAQGM